MWREKGGVTVNGYRGFFLGVMKMFKIYCGDGCTTLNILKTTELYNLFF